MMDGCSGLFLVLNLHFGLRKCWIYASEQQQHILKEERHGRDTSQLRGSLSAMWLEYWVFNGYR